MRLSPFESCLPELLKQLGQFQANPGEIPLSLLAFCGALTLREQQLNEAETTVSLLAVESLAMASKLEMADESARVAHANAAQLQTENEYLRQAYEARNRLCLSYESRMHLALRELDAIREKLQAYDTSKLLVHE